MKFRDLHKVWKEALMLYEVYRRLGFTPDEIFMEPAYAADASRALLWKQTRDGDLCISMVVRAQGLEYHGCIGPAPCYSDKIASEWKAAATLFNESDTKEVDRIWQTALVPTKLENVALAMAAKGFVLPFKRNLS